MPQITDLKELLKHEIMDLYSAEQQIIDALPAMIEKAGNQELKNALQEHLKITETQKTRLEEIQQFMMDKNAAEGDEQNAEQNNDGDSRKGFFSRLFGTSEQKCKGMEGLINEGNKMMGEDMSPEVADAAIIASAQKIEHYEISGYGTARAYARELNLGEVADKLEQTLNEEYEADDRLTALAVGKLNLEAESPAESQNDNQLSTADPKKSVAKSAKNVAALKSNRNSSKKPAPTKSSKSAPGKGKSSASKSGSRPALKSASKFSASKTASKSSASKKASSSNSRNAALKSAAKSKRVGNSKASGAKKSSAKKTSGTKAKSSRRR